MNDFNVLEIDRNDYDTREEFANAVRDAVIVLLNNHYIMTVEKCDDIVGIIYNYDDAEYGCSSPHWLSPEEWENVLNNRDGEENE